MRGLPRAWGGLLPSRRRRRSCVDPLMVRGDASPCRNAQRGSASHEGLIPFRLRRGLGRLGGLSVVVLSCFWSISRKSISRIKTQIVPGDCSPHSANPCHLCCSNAASRRRIAPATIAALTDCERLQTRPWRTTRLKKSARVCGQMLTFIRHTGPAADMAPINKLMMALLATSSRALRPPAPCAHPMLPS